MRKLAIIGASELQEPLIRKAKSMGVETHVFAWAAGDVGEKSADVFYPISIVEKEKILEVCREVGVDGICSIASDLAMITVGYVADALGLVGNTPDAVERSTNKHLMRAAFERGGDPSPRSILADADTNLDALDLTYPVIVKPTDRSGSRGIFKLEGPELLSSAVEAALGQSFEKKVLIEEFAGGREYSVEFISYRGDHRFLALTQKFTTGAPHFIETGHLEPAQVNAETLERVKAVVVHALDTLGLKNGASHSELKIDEDGRIRIIEIGGRMGGDFIGSDLVELSTGYDFVRAVAEVALGEKPALPESIAPKAASAVRFIFSDADAEAFARLQREHPEFIVDSDVRPCGGEVTDSSNRFGHFLMRAGTAAELLPYLPAE
ncbi:MAG: ATP-grasp domain-containing protein [Clostridia bacterium]|nr:ATP-grasp domain-containing protein [Clostridia bacterium]